MKHIILFLVFAFCLSAWQSKPQKLLKVEGDLPSWQALLDCVEKSTAPHTEVKAVQEWIVGQLQKQLEDSTKKNPAQKP